LLDPENSLALWGFAGICRDRGQMDDAIRYFEMAIQREPENAKLESDYQNTLLQMRLREQALATR
jgi:Tfp pilus assembly protein PilF